MPPASLVYLLRDLPTTHGVVHLDPGARVEWCPGFYEADHARVRAQVRAHRPATALLVPAGNECQWPCGWGSEGMRDEGTRDEGTRDEGMREEDVSEGQGVMVDWTYICSRVTPAEDMTPFGALRMGVGIK